MPVLRPAIALAFTFTSATSHAAVTDVLISAAPARSACDTQYTEFGLGTIMSNDGVIVVLGNASDCPGLRLRVSRDGGATFAPQQQLPLLPTPTWGTLATAASSGTGIIDIVTRDGFLHRSTDAGASFATPVQVLGVDWSSEETAWPSIGTSPAGSLAISWPWGVTNGGTTLSSDGGATWKAPVPNVAGQLLWLDSDRLLICAGTTAAGTPACWRSGDRGASVTAVTGQALAYSNTGLHPLALGRTNVEVFSFSRQDADLFHSTDAGSSWSKHTVPTSGHVRSISAVPGGTEVWLTTTERELFRSRDGVNWESIAPPSDTFFPHITGLDVGAFAGFGVAVTGAPYAMTWRSTDSGERWSEAVSPDGFFGLPIEHVALLRVGTDRLVALWADASDVTAPIHASVSDDYGRSWSPPRRVTDGQRELLREFSAVASDAGGVAVLWPTPQGMRLSASANGIDWLPSVPVAPWSGAAYEWNRSYQRSDGKTAFLAIDGAGRLVASRPNPPEISRSIDFGQTWSYPSPLALSAVASGAPAVIGDSVVIPLEVSLGWQAIARTADAGLTWDFSVNHFWEIPTLFAERDRLVATWRMRGGAHWWQDVSDQSLDLGRSWSPIEPILPREGVLAADTAGNLYHFVYQGGVNGIGVRLMNGATARFEGFTIHSSTEYAAVALSPLHLGVLYAVNEPADGVTGVHFSMLDAGGVTLLRGSTPASLSPYIIGVRPGVETDGVGAFASSVGLTLYRLAGAPAGTRLLAAKCTKGARLIW